MQKNTKIVVVVFGGLGGVQSGPNMLTELQQAYMPNTDKLVRRSATGLLWPESRGSVPDKNRALADLLGLNEKKSFPPTTEPESCALVEKGSDLTFWKNRNLSVYPVPFEKMASSLKEKYQQFDLFFLYIHRTESCGLKGEYYPKIIALEKFDPQIGEILKLEPTVLAITGDSSVPTAVQKRTWHPVPVLIFSRTCRYDDVMEFDELSCRNGVLGHMQNRELMPIIWAMAEQNNE